MSERRFRHLGLSLPLILLGAGLSACGGAGRHGPAVDRSGRLLAIEFLGHEGEARHPEADPPRLAPLLQQILFRFDGAPDPDQVDRQALWIRDAQGFPVPGTFSVNGLEVIFTPSLPRSASAESESTAETSGAGLRPGEIYSVRAAPRLWPGFLSSIDVGLRKRFPDSLDPEGVSLSFRTTTNPDDYFRGLLPRRPLLVSTRPQDGASDVSPMLYSDPEGRFPPRTPFTLTFDAPVHPGSFNLEGFRLFDLDDTDEDPAGLSLGLEVRVVDNQLDSAVVELRPSGILPFGHLLSLERPVKLRGLSQEPLPPGEESAIAATFTTSASPGDSIDDELREDFSTRTRREAGVEEIPLGAIPADWDLQDSNLLQASVVIDGFGELGRFVPAPPGSGESNRIIYLDTGRQLLPLLDGSTPDAPAGTEVIGGVFSFTEIDIPDGIVIRVLGVNPLVLSATESVRIAGEFQLQGGPGNADFTLDSAVFSMPGGKPGPGGGRGGEGHPIIYQGGIVNVFNLVDPPSGGRGFGPLDRERVGGFGGQCGILDLPDGNGDYTTDSEIQCGESSDLHNNGYKAPGGGGGSYLAEGVRPRPGLGNVIVDGLGNYIVRTPDQDQHDQLASGAAGQRPFRDEDPLNDFVGRRGELQEFFGAQGGGSGGSVVDSYFCGRWCYHDADPTNDAVCQAEFFDPPIWPDSAGDARGGGGGGGGGALVIRSMSSIELERTARLLCQGGSGGGGEQQSCSNWGGCGGGGAGGLVSLQAIHDIVVRRDAVIEVSGGPGKYATSHMGWINSSSACAGSRDPQHRGSGGDGGHGLIQLQLRPGQRATVESGAKLTAEAWVDPDNERNPSEFSSVSIGVSRWYDMGRTIARPPEETNPLFRFRGTDPATGLVLTDEFGDQLEPRSSDIECDYLGQLDPRRPGEYIEGQEPRADHIPPSASVRVEFQAASAIAPGSKEVDPASLSPWSTDVEPLSASQFLRYRVTFDTTADGADLSALTPRPAVQSIKVRTVF